jgi:hypothetical protein
MTTEDLALLLMEEVKRQLKARDGPTANGCYLGATGWSDAEGEWHGSPYVIALDGRIDLLALAEMVIKTKTDFDAN